MVTIAVSPCKAIPEWSTLEYTKGDGAKVKQVYTGVSYVEYEMYPNKLYNMLREYYLSGNLKKEGMQLGNMPIGIWKEFDEQGNLTKETNWDEKYGKFDYNQVVLFLDKKGHIDIKTGKHREDMGIAYDEARNRWLVYVFANPDNAFKGYSYELDGNTGKVKKQNALHRANEFILLDIIAVPLKSQIAL